jgi:hypothetical protein
MTSYGIYKIMILYWKTLFLRKCFIYTGHRISKTIWTCPFQSSKMLSVSGSVSHHSLTIYSVSRKYLNDAHIDENITMPSYLSQSTTENYTYFPQLNQLTCLLKSGLLWRKWRRLLLVHMFVFNYDYLTFPPCNKF